MTEKTDDLEALAAFRPNPKGKCEVCGAGPTVAATGLCGPHTWGEAGTADGAWWDEDDEKRYLALGGKP